MAISLLSISGSLGHVELLILPLLILGNVWSELFVMTFGSVTLLLGMLAKFIICVDSAVPVSSSIFAGSLGSVGLLALFSLVLGNTCVSSNSFV